MWKQSRRLVAGKVFDICIVVAGQPATNPRTVKEAEALSGQGYSVCVVYAFSIGWADSVDESIINRNHSIYWKLVAGNPQKSPIRFYINSLLSKAFKLSAVAIRAHRKYTLNRSSWALCRTARRIRARFYIGHNLAALPAVAMAAEKSKGSYSFDAEDYHRGQFPGNLRETRDIIHIENSYLPGAGYVSAASSLIAEKYKEHYPKLEVQVINNVFSVRHLNSHFSMYQPGSPLRLFWFSQTVSSGRGIEDVIAAIVLLQDSRIEFTILGNCSGEEQKRLEDLAGPQKSQIRFISPVPQDDLFDIASRQHIGLALEGDGTVNRDICLTNKIFTYLLSGLAIVATDTSAQKQFLQSYPFCGEVFRSGQIPQLAALIDRFLKSPDLLNEARLASHRLAESRLNWEVEQQVLFSLVKPFTPVS